MTDSPKPESPNPERPSFFAELKRRKVVRVAITYAIVAWLIIQVAAATFPGFEIPMWAFRFVVLMLILGFPVALVLAWAFELTPDGIKLTKNVSEEQKVVTSQAKRNWLSLGFAAALPAVIFGSLALYFYFTRSVAEPVSTAFDKSIAVLPFENRSNVDEDQFFTDGIHDDLLTHISRIRDIKTISRTSVMGYKGTEKNMKQIGEELGVATLLEGGVQRSGNQIRINMQLIDATTDAHIWSEIYTREMNAENVFAIQSEITEAIATALRSVLSPEEQKQLNKLPTKNTAALEAFFEGKQELNKRTAESISKGIEHFRKAVELDDAFAPAYAQWAISELLLIFHAGRPPETQVAKAEPLIETAIRLDKRLEDNYVALGLLERNRGSRMAAELAFEKAVELNPNNADAYIEFGVFTTWGLFRPKDAVRLLEKALQIDPKNTQVMQNLADALSMSFQSKEAIEILDRAILNNPELPMLHLMQGGIYTQSFQDNPNSIKQLRIAHSLDPLNPRTLASLAGVYGKIGDSQSALYWFDRVIMQYPDYSNISTIRLAADSLRGDSQAGLDRYRTTAIRSDFHLNGLGRIALWDEDSSDRAWAIEQAQIAAPYLVGADPKISTGGYALSEAISYASMLCSNGRREETGPLFVAIMEYIQSRKKAERSELLSEIVCAYVLAGDTKRALSELRAYVESGGAILFTDQLGLVFINENLVYRELKDEPEFQELVAIMNERLADQRAQVERWEANGELAPIPSLGK